MRSPDVRTEEMDKAAKKKEQADKGSKEKDPKRSKTTGRVRGMAEVDEDDLPIIQNLAKFPTERRIPVITFDDSLSSMDEVEEHYKNGMPFIARPKRGKSILKVFEVSWKF